MTENVSQAQVHLENEERGRNTGDSLRICRCCKDLTTCYCVDVMCYSCNKYSSDELHIQHTGDMKISDHNFV